MFIADETWELTHSVRSAMSKAENWSFSVPDQHGTPDGVPRYTVSAVYKYRTPNGVSIAHRSWW